MIWNLSRGVHHSPPVQGFHLGAAGAQGGFVQDEAQRKWLPSGGLPSFRDLNPFSFESF